MESITELNNNNYCEVDENNEHLTQETRLRQLTRTYRGIEKPLKGMPMCQTLPELISELHKAFSSDHVNIEYVHHLMLSYNSNPAEWKKFAKFDRFRYTRNLVDAGNGKFNLMILCWGEAHSSAIHDHADSHCFMKMLRGELTEVRFAWPTNAAAVLDANGNNADIGAQVDDEDYGDGSELQEICRNKIGLNDVAYINDHIGLHRVENASHTEPAVSLHLYCPPFNECSVFNNKTGKRTKCQVTFWSKFGHKRDRTLLSNISGDK